MNVSIQTKRQRLSKYLNYHDSIIKAISSYGFKDVLTIEEGNFFYWVRQYQNGRLLQTYGYYNDEPKALEKYNLIKQELIKYGIKLRYNKI